MKKTILTLVLSGLIAIGFAQIEHPIGKATIKDGKFIVDTLKKPVYDYFAKLPVQDAQQYFSILTDYRRLITYDPNQTPEQKINMQQGIDKYLKTLNEKIKIDSLVKK